MKLLRNPRVAWSFAALAFAGVGYLSLAPGPPGMEEIPGSDKTAHAAAYLTLAVILAHALSRSGVVGWRRVVLAILVPAAYGEILEVLQYFVPPREPDLLDALCNLTGAVVGTIGYGLAGKIGRARRRSGVT
ncbi:MAG: VanZ family protein [Planctomycetota bacterium]